MFIFPKFQSQISTKINYDSYMLKGGGDVCGGGGGSYRILADFLMWLTLEPYYYKIIPDRQRYAFLKKKNTKQCF